MTLAKRLSISFAAVAAVLTVGTLGSGSAQAMIVTGSVTGTWDGSFGQGANVNVGDTFTADYSYDDATLKPYNVSNPGYYQYSEYYGSLLSLIVNSGSYSHTFDLANGYGFVSFADFAYDPSYVPYSYKTFSVQGYDYTSPGFNFFDSYTQKVDDHGTPSKYQSARLYTYDNQVENYPNGVYAFSNVKFTPDPTATAVPTPALLPGLIGLGIGVLRKRKGNVAEQAIEA